ncbi:hypothetical protein [Thiolapillus sp.]|uniref:hypothetical protein n=1 Tax=Thiolapillus sp. TaxID=2017437 RepID=UPI003AF56E3D
MIKRMLAGGFTFAVGDKAIRKLFTIIRQHLGDDKRRLLQACLRPRDRFWDTPVPKIDSAFDNLLVPQQSWSPSTTQQLRKLVAVPYLPPLWRYAHDG